MKKNAKNTINTTTKLSVAIETLLPLHLANIVGGAGGPDGGAQGAQRKGASSWLSAGVGCSACC